ncbi:unnamed protein product [Schistocephalus solidus]|uniref:Tyrosine-protein phosphatase domain-containing protein n=1 Tax=Schistocephalus solidus TaxID=70667 RepID=A0A183TC28_SCHSO|nr:unnamed protein product [Schistocephalus solidus]
MPHSVGLKTLNRYKNRSEQSLPYDHSRVKLKRSLNSPENDYINASFVDGYMRRKAYIAAQSPFNATTAADFWVMIFQCNVSQIVMLTNQIEGGAVCCTKYWPEVSCSCCIWSLWMQNLFRLDHIDRFEPTQSILPSSDNCLDCQNFVNSGDSRFLKINSTVRIRKGSLIHICLVFDSVICKTTCK